MPAPKSLADPYSTLGLEPGAPMAEVKRAYRRLAKSFHPDSAGEAAMPRFLAIQAAYEQIRTGRPASGAGRSARTGSSPAGAEPWRADPARARAARERARTGRSGAPGTTGAHAPGPGGARAPGSGARGSGAPGSAGPGASSSAGARGAGGRASTGTTGTSRRRATRKATMGSTSYDDARDHADATWSGASWYGPSTGEYWIVNPREYADPRKHGPDYQSRARRPAQAGDNPVADLGAADLGAADLGTPAGPGEPVAPAGPDEAPPPASPAGATAGASWMPPGPRAAASTRAERPSTTRAGRSWSEGPATGAWSASGDRRPEGRSGEPAVRRTLGWLTSPADDPVRRFGLALVAWPPIGLVAAALIGDATGCSTFAAGCDGAEPMLPWLAQAVILGLLLLLPPLARILAAGTIAVLAGMLPVAVVLVALGGPAASAAGGALVILLAALWCGGVAVAASMRLRGLVIRDGPTGSPT